MPYLHIFLFASSMLIVFNLISFKFKKLIQTKSELSTHDLACH